MTRQRFRWILVLMLIASAGFAIWTWARPYEWRSDPGAGFQIVAAGVRKDHSFYWLDLRLKARPGAEHDLRKPVYLETGGHQRVEPTDITLAGDMEQPIDEIFLRFWLESSALDGPIHLHMNDGVLSVRTGSGEPRLGNNGHENFNTRRW